MKSKKYIGLFSVIIFVILLTVMCSAYVGAATIEKKTDGTLVYGIREEPDNLNPFKTTRAISDNIMNYILEPLVTLDKNFKPMPGLSESWELSEDGKVYTFKLKQGVEFHDGTAFNADAVVFSFEHAMEGNEAFAIESINDVIKVDDYTVKFLLETPSIAFLFNIADAFFGIISPTAYEKNEDRWGTEVLVGTGPFKFDKWVRSQDITLVRNEKYNHGPEFLDNKGPAYLEKIVFKIIPEATILVGAVKSGDIDFTPYVPSSFVEQLKKDSSIQFFNAPSYGTRFLTFNLKKEVFQDKQIRLAIAHAIDKNPIANIAWRGAAIPTCSILGPATVGYYDTSDKCIDYDIEKSKQILAEAGWEDTDNDGILEKDGKKFEISLLSYSLSENAKTCVIIKDQLGKVGINVNVEALEKGAAIAKGQAGDFDIMEFGVGFTTGDLFLNYIAYSKNIGVGNLAFYENSKFDELMVKASMIADIDEFNENLKKAQDILLEDLPFVPLVALTNSMMAKLEVGGLDTVVEYPFWYDWHVRVLGLEIFFKK
jgi:peptide/nickel transport system substrate-binding protein